MTRFLSVAWLLVALPAFAGAQNRVTNGSFDVDLAGWDFPDATPVWTAFDIANSPESGSALATNASPMADSVVVVLRQCLPITKVGRYTLRASTFIPTGQVAGDVAASYGYGRSADCSPLYYGVGGFYMPSAGAWKTYDSGTIINVPDTVPPMTSILVQLRLEKTPADGVFQAYIDDVSLVYDGIFDDSFESLQP